MAEEKEKKELNKFIKKISKNYWAISTIVLAVLLVVVLLYNPSSVSASTAGEKALEFLNSQTGGGVEIVEVNSLGNLYEIVVSYQEQQIPVYMTKDGENLVQGIIPITGQAITNPETTPTPSEVQKSDKPSVELFVMTHCPYGTQAEKGFIPAITLLGNKIDASVKFVHYFLHEPEKTETPTQICIREEQSEKYMAYLKEFLVEGNSEKSLTKAGIDKTKLNDCKTNRYEELYASDSQLSEFYGVQGSPTLVINGAIVSSGRSPQAYLDTICSAFNVAPEQCSQTLDSATPSAGFGYSTTSSIASAQC